MLDAEQSVLVVVDVQGKLAQLMAERETLFANLQRMVRGAQALDLPILWAEQNPEKLGPTIPEVAGLLQGIEPLPKMTFSCAGNPAFVQALQALGRKQVVIVGIEAHICVYHTAVDLSASGYQVQVVADAVGTRIASNKDLALNKMLRRGVELTSTEMALFEMLESCEHACFKQVQAIIK